MLEKIKRLLGLDGNEKDALLEDIIETIEGRLKVRIGETAVPSELSYIVVEVAVSRYNKIGNEGMKNYSQDGEAISFDDLFADYAADIAEWKESKGTGVAEYGGFRFI